MDEFGLDSSMTMIDNNAMIEEESNVVDSENVLPPFITRFNNHFDFCLW